jgi:deoxycytidylate deaminase
MRIINFGDKDFELVKFWISRAGKEAENSLCLRSSCGAIVAKDYNCLGKGFNSPPGNIKLERCFKDTLPENFKSNRDCCNHAEERAIVLARDKWSPVSVQGSTLYFARINENKKIITVGKPYCTQCSKMALDNKIAKWVLLHDFGFCEYDAEEYNEISFGRKEWKI